MNAFETDLTNQGISTNAESIASERPEFKKRAVVTVSSPSSSITWGFRVVLMLTAALLAVAIVFGIFAIIHASDAKYYSQYTESEVAEIKRIAEHPGVEFSKFISECRSEEATVDNLEREWSNVQNQLLDIEAPWERVEYLAEQLGFFYPEYIPVYDQNGNWVMSVYQQKVDTEKVALLEQALLEDLDELAYNLELALSDSNKVYVYANSSSVFQVRYGYGGGVLEDIERKHQYKDEAYENAVLFGIFLAIGIVGIIISKILYGKLKEQQKVAEEQKIRNALAQDYNALHYPTLVAMQMQIDLLMNTNSKGEPLTEDDVREMQERISTLRETARTASVAEDPSTPQNAQGLTDAAAPDALTRPKAPKNPIKYLKHVWKTPVKTKADLKQAKKELLPITIVSAALIAVPLILCAFIDAFWLSSVSILGLPGAFYCGFLYFILKKASEKFDILTCEGCKNMITAETPEALRKELP